EAGNAGRRSHDDTRTFDDRGPERNEAPLFRPFVFPGLPEEPTEEPHGRVVEGPKRESGEPEELKEEAIRGAARKTQPRPPRLIERVVDERGEVGLRPPRSRVDDAVWRSEKDVEDADLRRASVPGVAGENGDRALLRDLEPPHAVVILERHVVLEGVSR